MSGTDESHGKDMIIACIIKLGYIIEKMQLFRMSDAHGDRHAYVYNIRCQSPCAPL